MSPITIPKFASETEEADWWYENREVLAAEFDLAGREGRLRAGTTAKLAAVAEMGLTLSRADVLKASEAADAKGIPFKQYLSELIHVALERDAAA